MSIEKILKFVFFCALLLLIILIVENPQKIRLSRDPITYYVAPSSSDPSFKSIAENIIARSELSKKYKLKLVNTNNATITIEMPSKEVMDKFDVDDKAEYYPNSNKRIRFSYTIQGPAMKPRIYINYINWQGVPESGLNLDEYRNYVVLHELMHALGFDHQKCNSQTAEQGVCPLMYQSTRGPPSKAFRCGYKPLAADFTTKLDGRFLY